MPIQLRNKPTTGYEIEVWVYKNAIEEENISRDIWLISHLSTYQKN